MIFKIVKIKALFGRAFLIDALISRTKIFLTYQTLQPGGWVVVQVSVVIMAGLITVNIFQIITPYYIKGK
jgi:hypothetical protein